MGNTLSITFAENEYITTGSFSTVDDYKKLDSNYNCPQTTTLILKDENSYNQYIISSQGVAMNTSQEACIQNNTKNNIYWNIQDNTHTIDPNLNICVNIQSGDITSKKKSDKALEYGMAGGATIVAGVGLLGLGYYYRDRIKKLIYKKEGINNNDLRDIGD
ncbi:MAG: hypothetical protein EBS86_17595, partial [Crocinitomicaceae bacterium]|nr:hypothetical protein [Crocinitomicaceae bacterium]